MALYRDRVDAGQQLARELSDYAGRGDAIVIALPRGGVPVGFEVAKALNLPLDVLAVRKIGVPGKEELAMGAVASGGIRVLNQSVIDMYKIVGSMIDEATEMARDELERCESIYRSGMPPLNVEGKTVILVDDGIATGTTIRAALAALRRLKPARIVVSAPTAQATVCDQLDQEADEVLCAMTPVPFLRVATWYQYYCQTSDEDVRALLEEAKELRKAA